MTATHRPGLALSAPRRAPRRRQARAREHADGDARRPRARLPDGRVRREALRRQPVVPAARRDARAHDERPRPRRRAAVARAVAARRRRLAFGEVRGRAAAHARVDRPLGARARRRLQRRDQAHARPRARDRRRGRARRRRVVARRRGAAAAVVVLGGGARRRAGRRARAAARAAGGHVPADWQERLARLECVALDVDHESLDADIVRRVRAAGFRVLCYTPNEPERIASLAAWGVDGIITDAVDHVAADSLPPPLPLP